jgi:LysR family transcriptional regulator, cys regulon transcriptional activator
MTLQQLRYLCAIADASFNVSRAAERVHTSQPGISKQIRLLETELGVDLLVRTRARISGLTAPGEAVVAIARRMLGEAANVRRAAADGASATRGELRVATTHIHARYHIPPILKGFRTRFPEVRLTLRQANPREIAQLLVADEADLGLTQAPDAIAPDLVRLPCFKIHRCIIAPAGHPLLRKRGISLRDLARYPLVNLDASYTGGAVVLRAFEREGIRPDIVVTATDAEVIKAYVTEGLGVGTLPTVAFDPRRDRRLRAIRCDGLFEPATTYILLQRNYYLRGFAEAFIRMLAPQWSEQGIRQALAAESSAGGPAGRAPRPTG